MCFEPLSKPCRASRPIEITLNACPEQQQLYKTLRVRTVVAQSETSNLTDTRPHRRRARILSAYCTRAYTQAFCLRCARCVRCVCLQPPSGVGLLQDSRHVIVAIVSAIPGSVYMLTENSFVVYDGSLHAFGWKTRLTVSIYTYSGLRDCSCSRGISKSKGSPY